MANRTFSACFFAYQDLSKKEDLVIAEILNLSIDLEFAAAIGTDEEFVETKSKLAAAEARLDEILKELKELDKDFEPHLQDFDKVG